MKILIVILLVIVNIPLYRRIFKAFFKKPGDFEESLKYSITPDFLSLIRGEWRRDQYGEFKFAGFIFIWILMIAIEFLLLLGVLRLFNLNL